METGIEEKIEARFIALRRIHPGALSIRHRLLWQWLEARELLQPAFEPLDSHASDMPSLEGVAREVVEGSEPMSLLASTQTPEEYVGLAYVVAQHCVEAPNERLELELARRLGARGDGEAVELFYDVILEPVGQWLAEQVAKSWPPTRKSSGNSVAEPIADEPEPQADDRNDAQPAEAGAYEDSVAIDEPTAEDPQETSGAHPEPPEEPTELQQTAPAECGDEQDDLPENHGKPWEDEDIGHLVDLVEFGLDVSEIAETLGRSTKSITMRIDDLVEEGKLFSPGAARLIVVGPDDNFYEKWQEIVEFIDEEWRSLARGLRNRGIAPPTDVHATIDVDGGATDHQALMLWEEVEPPVAMIAAEEAKRWTIVGFELLPVHPHESVDEVLSRLDGQARTELDQAIEMIGEENWKSATKFEQKLVECDLHDFSLSVAVRNFRRQHGLKERGN